MSGEYFFFYSRIPRYDEHILLEFRYFFPQEMQYLIAQRIPPAVRNYTFG